MTLDRSSTSNSKVEQVAGEREQERFTRRYPVAAVITLVLVCLLEILVYSSREFYWDANYLLLERKRNALTARTIPADDVAIFGSSRFYHVRPQVVKQVVGTDKRVTNYSWGWCGVEAYEAMLRGLINAGRIPEVIVTDSYPEIFGYPERLLTITKFDSIRTGYFHTVPPVAGVRTLIGLKEWGTLWSRFTHFATPPTALYSSWIRQALTKIVHSGELPPPPADYDQLVTTWQKQGWFLYTPPERVAKREEFDSLEKATGPYKLRDNGYVKRAYERFISLAHKHNIKIVMLAVPNNELVFETFMRDGIYLAFDRWLHDLTVKYENFKAPPPRWYTWPGTLGDANHVNAYGSDEHMKMIKELLEKELR